MATLAKSAVALYPTGTANLSESEFLNYTKPDMVTRRLKLTLTGQGGQTNTITAHALGFETLVTCSNLFDDENNKIYLACIDPVGSMILLSATAADTVADITSNAAYITVQGLLRLDAGLT